MTTAPVTRPPQAPATLRMTPGRWVALAIGVPIALAFIGWTGFSLVAAIGQASFPVNTAIPVHDGHLVASTGGGDLTVHQGQARSTKARLIGTVQYSLVRPRLTVGGDGLDLSCRIPTGNCGLTAVLDVPLDTAVQLASGGGNMQVSGIDSDVTLDSGGGEVTVSGVRGIADVTTGGGNLTVSDLGHTLKFSTDGGEVDGTGLFAPQVDTESGGGNVTLVFTRVPAHLKVISSGGEISIVLPHSSTAYYIASSTEGGDYSARVPTTTNPKASHQITVDSGGGNASITQAS
jgi:Putative adhesin